MIESSEDHVAQKCAPQLIYSEEVPGRRDPPDLVGDLRVRGCSIQVEPIQAIIDKLMNSIEAEEYVLIVRLYPIIKGLNTSILEERRK